MLVRLKEGGNRDTQIKIKQTCLFKTFFISSIVDDADIVLPVFPSRM